MGVERPRRSAAGGRRKVVKRAASAEETSASRGAAASPASKRRRLSVPASPSVVAPHRVTTALPDAPPGAGSAFRDVDVDALYGSWLGKSFPAPGKAAVVECVVRGEDPPRFAKLCGLLQWRNCVQLWVNVGDDHRYVNTFRRGKGSTTMTWYASASANPDTHAIRRLTAAATAPLRGKDPVLLFCRLEGRPYVFMGRVQLVSMEPAARPLEFVFKLVDAARWGKAARDVVAVGLRS
eukprot:TRINITY_DN11673_c0_g1_i1.p1 TRINITY_DN11673_c0_g1~~TRINITY_DN11673_c0_g1_i1.p1  ORF type:complete len:259 (+),score=49.81 TRINITY_DN11673_c0_g1_i1:68-778(+)